MKTLQKTLAGLLILTLFVPNVALFAQSIDVPPESLPLSSSETIKNTDSLSTQINNDSGVSVVTGNSNLETPSSEVILENKDSDAQSEDTVSQKETFPEASDVKMPSTSQYTLPGGTRTPEITYQQKVNTTVDTFSGALTQSIPIQIPAGRNGLQPDITLQYNNQNQDSFSHVGFGWNLSIPSIERLNKTGMERLYTDNFFTSSLSGELASTSDATLFKTKNENGDFLKYSFVSNTWTVVDKQGITYTFGDTDTSRQSFASSTASTTKWMLSEVRDTNDNFYRYEYVKDGNEIYPRKVFYTGNGTQDGVYTLEFVLENRPDAYVSYKSGYKVEIKKRIKEINIKANNAERAKYVLAYAPGANGTRSLLLSVAESRTSQSGAVTVMPPTTFQYTNDPVTYVRRDENANPATRDGYFQSGRVAIDFDGNGLNEKVASYSMDYNNGVSTGSMNGQVLNLGEGRAQAFNSIVPAPWTTGSNGFPEEFLDYGVRVFDVNGDLSPDLVRASTPRLEESSIPGLFLNTGDLNFATSTLNNQIPTFRYYYYTGAAFAYVNAALLANVNGDQLVDTYSLSTQCTLTALPGPTQHFCGLVGAYIGTGEGWRMNPRNLFSAQLVHGGEIPSTIIFADVNGDGLDDQIKQVGASTTAVYLNLGDNTWSATSSSWLIPHPLQEHDAWPKYDQGVRVFDINGDGLVDIIRSFNVDVPNNTNNMTVNATGRYMPFPTQGSYRVAYLNTGSEWVQNQAIPLSGVVDNIEIINFNWRGGFLINDSYFDANGDGLVDFGNNIRQGRKPDMLIKTTYSTGATVDVEYKPTPQQVLPETNMQAHPKLPSVIYTVSKIIKSPGNGGTHEISEYAYEGGKNDFRGPNTLKFAGFKKVIETRGDTKTTTYFHQGDDSDASLGEQNDHYAKIGKPFRVDTTDLSNNLYARTWHTWQAVDRGNNSWYTYVSDTVDQVYDGNTGHRDTATSYVYSTTTGSLLTETKWGEVLGGASPLFVDIGNDKRITSFSYANNGALFVPTEISSVDYAGVVTQKTRFYYDNLPFGNVGVGNNTKVEKYTSVNTFVTTRKTYNSFGLVTEERDANNNLTSFTYETHNLLPETITNVYNQSTLYTYDYSTGKPLTITTPNTVYVFTYDGFGRPLSESIEDENKVSVYKNTYSYTDMPGSLSVQTSKHIDATNIVDTYSYVDGLYRPIQTKQEGEHGNWITVDTAYNTNGKIQRQSLPYFTATNSKSPATTTASLFTAFSYDPLLRVARETNAVGATLYAYDDWKKTITDPLLRSSHYYNDAFGNLVRVTETTGLTDYHTHYEYDTNNKLTKITDANGNIRNFTYDLLGRQLSAEDTHASNDATFGTYAYLYDNQSNVIQKTTPSGAVVTYTYDSLNRVKTEDVASSPLVDITYAYDTCENGVGRLCLTTRPKVSISFSYTKDGNVSKTIVDIDKTPFITFFAYTRQGDIAQIVNPNGVQLGYSFNNAGLVENIYESLYESKRAALPVISNIDYAPTGLPVLQVNANGTQTCYTYNAAQLYRLIEKKTVLSSTSCASSAQTSTLPTDFNQVKETAEDKFAQLLTPGAYTTRDTGEMILIKPEVVRESEYEKESLIGFTKDKQPLYQYEVVIGKDVQGNNTPIALNILDTENGSQSVATSSTSIAPQATVLATNYYAGNIVPYPDPWDVIRNVATGTYAYGPGSLSYVTSELGRDRAQANIHRLFMNFDTQNIPDNALLQNVYLDLYALPYSNTSSPTDYIGVLQSLQTATSSISIGDYSKCGSPQSLPVLGGKKLLTEFTAQNYYRLPLFAEAKPWINLQGTTSLCLREGHDIENEAPPENTWDFARRGIAVLPETTHVSQRSKIVVEYTLPVATTTTSSFPLTNVSPLSQPLSNSNIYTSNYVYDSVGNVKSITNTTGTSTSETVAYEYDNLNRLLSATGPSLEESFTYDAIGNILTKNGVPYVYEAPHKTNPHAVTRVGDISLSYDANGNVLTIGEMLNPTTNIFNYRNELTSTTKASSTVSYLYNHEGTRLEKSVNGVRTSYPSAHFSQTSTGTSTTLVMLGNQNLATITNGTVLFNHTDHAGSTIATTNQTGGIIETTEYSAFGHQTQRSTFVGTQQTEKYTGHTYDPETDLLYAQARYYRGSLGRFLSQDPLHWQTPKEYLVDPQQQNSYSYARNNPLKFVDTTGKYIESGVDVASLSLSVQDYQQDPSLANAAFVGLDAAALFLPAPALVGYVRHGGELFDVAKAGGKVVEQVQNGMAASKEVGNTNQIKSLIELNNNQNRVTLRSTSQKLEVDLAGKSHFDKTSGVNIPTPHTKTSTVNPSAPKSLGIQYNTTNGVLRPATIFDLRTVRRFLESSKKKK